MLFIGNPTYEKLLENTDLNLQQQNTTPPDPDDIYGVEFYGFPKGKERPSTKEDTTPFSLIKAKRLFAAQNLHFRPACISKNDPGVDDFYKYAGPFKIRECATLLNTTTGKQEVVAYKDEMSFSDWISKYDKTYTANKRNMSSTEPISLSGNNQSNTVYNIMIEFPKFWYCRPSRYTFLVSTKDQSDRLAGTHWFISPMHKRSTVKFEYNSTTKKIETTETDLTKTEVYDYCYISKYVLSQQSDTVTKRCYAASVNSPSILMLSSLTTLENVGFDIMDYSIWSMLWHLTLIKYATLDYRDSYIAPIKEDPTYHHTVAQKIELDREMWMVTNTSKLEISKNQPIWDAQRTITAKDENQVWTLLGLSYYGFTPTGCLALYTKNGLFNTTFNLIPWWNSKSDTYISNAISSYSTTCVHKLVNINDSTESEYYVNPGYTTSWTSFYWTENMASNEHLAWSFFPGGLADFTTNIQSSFLMGYHFCHTITKKNDHLYSSKMIGGHFILCDPSWSDLVRGTFFK